MNNNEASARRISYAFLAVAAVIIAALLFGILAEPYDSGVLSGSNLSGNNQYGGTLCATNDYLFFVTGGALVREERATGKREEVMQGDLRCLNPYDGWLYYLCDGGIYRVGYFGGQPLALGPERGVTSMSVNGLWLYYLQNGSLYKVRTDGRHRSRLTGDNVTVTAFEAANRLVVYTDGRTLYRMRTDGSDVAVLAEGGSISRMLYTLDDVFYCDGGEVKRLASVEAGRREAAEFSPLAATVFTYDVNARGRGQLYYLKGDELWLRQLRSVEDAAEEERLLLRGVQAVDLYSAAGRLFYHTGQGELFEVTVGSKEATVTPVNP